MRFSSALAPCTPWFAANSRAPACTMTLETSLRTYTSDDFECSYLYKPATPGHERAPPLLLVHPVTTSLPLLRPDRMIT